MAQLQFTGTITYDENEFTQAEIIELFKQRHDFENEALEGETVQAFADRVLSQMVVTNLREQQKQNERKAINSKADSIG